MERDYNAPREQDGQRAVRGLELRRQRAHTLERLQIECGRERRAQLEARLTHIDAELASLED